MEATNIKIEPMLFTKKEAAELLKVSVRTIDNWMKNNLISYVSFEGGAIRFRREHIERRIADCEKLSKSELQGRRFRKTA